MAILLSFFLFILYLSGNHFLGLFWLKREFSWNEKLFKYRWVQSTVSIYPVDLRNNANFRTKILPCMSFIFKFLVKFLIQPCFCFNSHKRIINHIPFSKLKNPIKMDIQNGAVYSLASEKIVHNFFVRHIHTTCKSNFFPEFKVLQLWNLCLLLMAADTPLIHEKCQKFSLRSPPFLKGGRSRNLRLSQ